MEQPGGMKLPDTLEHLGALDSERSVRLGPQADEAFEQRFAEDCLEHEDGANGHVFEQTSKRGPNSYRQAREHARLLTLRDVSFAIAPELCAQNLQRNRRPAVQVFGEEDVRIAAPPKPVCNAELSTKDALAAKEIRGGAHS